MQEVWWEMGMGSWTRLTDVGGAHAGGDLLAQRLAEGDVALLEDALEDLASLSVTRCGVRRSGKEGDLRWTGARGSTAWTCLRWLFDGGGCVICLS